MHSTAKSVSSLSQLEVENHYLRGEIEGIERTFAATHGDQFFTQAQQTLDNESQFDSYRQQAEDQMRQIQNEVFEKERELTRLQKEIHRLRNGTQTSGFGMTQSVGGHSQQSVEPYKKQLEALTSELEHESDRNLQILQQSVDEMNKAEEQIHKGREAEAQMIRKMETLQQELDNMNRKIEQIQKGTGFGARANRQMNFGRGSDYSGSRNSRNSRELSNQANQRKSSSNTRPGYGSYSRPTVNRSAERSGSNNTRPSKATYVPIHLRGQQKGPSPVRPNNVARTSPNQRGGSNTRTSPTIPVQGNRFGVNYRG